MCISPEKHIPPGAMVVIPSLEVLHLINYVFFPVWSGSTVGFEYHQGSIFSLRSALAESTCLPHLSEVLILNLKGRLLHGLDVVCTVQVYFSATAPFQQSHSLFINPEGPCKWHSASHSTITRWIWQLLIQTYDTKGKVPPFPLKAHSTRPVSASWTFQYQASISQIHKATTFSSVYTFTFYQVNAQASTDAGFYHKVTVELPPLTCWLLWACLPFVAVLTTHKLDCTWTRILHPVFLNILLRK